MDKFEELVTDLKKYKRKSLYRIAMRSGGNKLNKGFDIENKLLDKTTSSYLKRKRTVNIFMSFISDYFEKFIRTVRWVQIHRTYSVDKDYEYIN